MPEVPEIYQAVDRYIADLFAPEDDVLKSAIARGRAAGLPQIQVSSGLGKLLYLLAKMVDAKNVLELGTLAGYSTIWLGRALPPGGRLTTLEFDPNHARVASENLAVAGLSDKVEIVVGPALGTLPGVIDRATGPFDLVFLDADKINYPAYFRLFMRNVRSGSLVLADNVVRQGGVLDPQDDSQRAVRQLNAVMAADDRLEAIVLQQVGVKGHDGLAIARVK